MLLGEEFCSETSVRKVGAEVGADCYSGGMRRNRKDAGTITGSVEATAERVRLSGEIQKAMAERIAAETEIQQRFRTVVLMKLARIEEVLLGTEVRRARERCRGIHFEEGKGGGALNAGVYVRRRGGDPYAAQKAAKVGGLSGLRDLTLRLAESGKRSLRCAART
jgi:hypothetical protein